MNHRRTAALALAAGAALGLAGCAGPGWEGQGTIVELELMEYDHSGHRLTETEALEVTVITDRGTETSVEVMAECVEYLRVGQTLTRDQLVSECGDLSYSTDD